MNYKPLSEAIAEVFMAASNKQDFNTTYGDFLGSLQLKGEDTFAKVNDDTFTVSNYALKQFVKDRVGGSPAIFNDADLSVNTKMAYLTDKARPFMDRPLAVRQANGTIDSILSEQYVLFNNTTLAQTLVEFSAGGILPPMDDLYAHRFYMDDAARNVYIRVISPDHWNRRNGEEYYYGVAVSNNENGEAKLMVQPALARVACFNYTLAQSTIDTTHRWSTREDMVETLRKGFLVAGGTAHDMFDLQQQHKAVQFTDARAAFELIATKLGFPTRVKEASWEYWNREGEDRSVYGVTQAVTFGVQESTDVEGRRKPKWDVRTEIESEIWKWSNEMFGLHQSGASVDEWVNRSELVNKARVINTLETRDEWRSAAVQVAALSADGWQ